jgi:hypothetical protein
MYNRSQAGNLDSDYKQLVFFGPCLRPVCTVLQVAHTAVRISSSVEAFGPMLLRRCRVSAHGFGLGSGWDVRTAHSTRRLAAGRRRSCCRAASRGGVVPCVMRTCTDCLTREQRKLGYARHRIGHLSTVFYEAPSPLITWRARGTVLLFVELSTLLGRVTTH